MNEHPRRSMDTILSPIRVVAVDDRVGVSPPRPDRAGQDIIFFDTPRGLAQKNKIIKSSPPAWRVKDQGPRTKGQ